VLSIFAVSILFGVFLQKKNLFGVGGYIFWHWIKVEQKFFLLLNRDMVNFVLHIRHGY